MNKLAFTLSEILITLVIIGVVAALTIPSLMNSTMDQEYIAASKRIMNSVAEAGRQMSVEDDIKRYRNVTDFVERGLSKRIDINKYCAPSGQGSKQTTGVPSDCGFAENYTTPEGDSQSPVINFRQEISLKNFGAYYGWGGVSEGSAGTNHLKSYAFQMSNGYSILLFYNPKCKKPRDNWEKRTDSDGNIPYYTCMSGVYDMNGKKGPNQMGRDMGTFSVMYPGITSIASAALPDVGAIAKKVQNNLLATKYCEEQGKRMPSVEELGTLAMAYKLSTSFISTESEYFWSGTIADNDTVWSVALEQTGSKDREGKNVMDAVRCLR